MDYDYSAISHVPRARHPVFQHTLDTYASETNKVVSVWRAFANQDLAFKPHPRSSTVREIMKHQLLSERRFFGEFLGTPEPPASAVLPQDDQLQDYVQRMNELALPRLRFLAAQDEAWWLGKAPSSRSSASESGSSGAVSSTPPITARN